MSSQSTQLWRPSLWVQIATVAKWFLLLAFFPSSFSSIPAVCTISLITARWHLHFLSITICFGEAKERNHGKIPAGPSVGPTGIYEQCVGERGKKDFILFYFYKSTVHLISIILLALNSPASGTPVASWPGPCCPES